VSERGVGFGLCPSAQGFYTGRKDEEKLYYAVRDGRHTFRQGFTNLGTVGAPVPTGRRRVPDRRTPRGLPAPGVDRDQRVLKGSPSPPGRSSRTTNCLATAVDRFRCARRQPRVRMMTLATGSATDCELGNLEYDLGHGLLTSSCASGRPPSTGAPRVRGA